MINCIDMSDLQRKNKNGSHFKMYVTVILFSYDL